MTNSLRTLLNGIIDYAGMFPPANLPLAEAWNHYLRYRGEAESWMLGRFVCPVARLRELPREPAVPISVLGRGGEKHDFLANLRQDLADISTNPGIESLDVRFAPSLWGRDKTRGAASLLAAVSQTIETSPTPRLQVFYEIPAGDLTRKSLTAFAETLAMDNSISRMWKLRHMPDAGVKLRCAGPKPGEYPSPVALAELISVCAARQLPMKFTAGLHHPLRHAEGHGFLNVFLAGIFAHAHPVHESMICDIIENRDAKKFVFSEDEGRWDGLTVTREQIEKARKTFATSFGSCSFDEPREGLRALGLLS